MKKVNVSKLSQVGLDESLQILCDLRWDYQDLQPEARAAGLWWIEPFARTYAGDLVGVRLAPGTSSAPVELVTLGHRNVLTLSSSTKTLVPRLLVATPGESTWDTLKSLDAEAWRQLGKLHGALGGDAAGLASVRTRAEDGSGKALCAGKKAKPHEIRAGIATILKETDPACSEMVDCILALAQDDTTKSYPTQGSAFDVKVQSLSFAWHLDQGDEEIARKWAESLIVQPMNLDPTSLSGVASLFPNPAVNALKTYQAACALLENHSDLGKVARATCKRGYDGSAHLELAARFRQEKRPLDAFHALINAAYFEASRSQAFDEALDLAKTSPWKHVVRVLERWKKA